MARAWRFIIIGSAAMAVAGLAGTWWLRFDAVEGDNAHLSTAQSEATPTQFLNRQQAEKNLIAWFEALVATGHLDQAVRAALIRLAAEGPLKPGVSPARDLLIARLIALLPTLEPTLAREVLVALVKQPLSSADAARLLAQVERFSEPKLRATLLQRLLEQGLPVADLIPLLASKDPRIRAAAARALRRQSGAGTTPDSSPENPAARALAAAADHEADPRVRRAMTDPPTDKPPVFAEDRRNPIELPAAATRASARQFESIWEHTTGGEEFVNHSTVTIDHSGVAHIET